MWRALRKRFRKTGSGTQCFYPELDPMAGFEKIMKHKSQWDNPDRCRDDPHTKGAENLNILYGRRVGTR